MIQLRISFGRFVLLDLTAGYSEPEEAVEDELDEPVLAFGFVMPEEAEPAPDPVFRASE